VGPRGSGCLVQPDVASCEVRAPPELGVSTSLVPGLRRAADDKDYVGEVGRSSGWSLRWGEMMGIGVVMMIVIIVMIIIIKIRGAEGAGGGAPGQLQLVGEEGGVDNEGAGGEHQDANCGRGAAPTHLHILLMNWR
jgi:hypothetical protein